MKKVFVISMILGSFYSCSSQQMNSDDALKDVALRAQSTDSLLSRDGDEWATPIEINNSNRSEANKAIDGQNANSKKI